jgi:cyclopropane fatty-acyl-phospholipid synthase-like methyltransferase
MENQNNQFFDGYYKDIWKTIVPAELTIKETDFLLPYFNLGPNSKVLDLMCGYGRNAIALAQKGISVTAVDNLKAYTDEVATTAQKENLPLHVVNADVTAYKDDQQYDLVMCMGNSLQFFDKEETTALFKNIYRQLKPGGHFLINTWSIAEIAYKQYSTKSWSQVGDIKYLNSSQVFFNPTRIETESIMIAADGTTETKIGIDHIFSLNEIGAMLQVARLQLKEVYSIPGRKKFTLGEPRAYLVVEKGKG